MLQIPFLKQILQTWCNYVHSVLCFFSNGICINNVIKRRHDISKYPMYWLFKGTSLFKTALKYCNDNFIKQLSFHNTYIKSKTAEHFKGIWLRVISLLHNYRQVLISSYIKLLNLHFDYHDINITFFNKQRSFLYICYEMNVQRIIAFNRINWTKI